MRYDGWGRPEISGRNLKKGLAPRHRSCGTCAAWLIGRGEGALDGVCERAVAAGLERSDGVMGAGELAELAASAITCTYYACRAWAPWMNGGRDGDRAR